MLTRIWDTGAGASWPPQAITASPASGKRVATGRRHWVFTGGSLFLRLLLLRAWNGSPSVSAMSLPYVAVL